MKQFDLRHLKKMRGPDGRVVAGTRQWYRVRAAAANNDPVEILIYDEIGRGYFGGGVSAEDFVKEVQALNLTANDTLLVRINSPGGDLFDGNTMYNYLRSQKAKVNVVVDGVAASAASIIAMAGDTVEMPANSYLFIHNPLTVAYGNANEFRRVADELDTIRQGAMTPYMRRAGNNLTQQDIIDLMDAESWIGAKQAVEYGFADSVVDPIKVAASINFDDYGIRPPPVMKLETARSRFEAEKNRF